jgi:hypothetical protein
MTRPAASKVKSRLLSAIRGICERRAAANIRRDPALWENLSAYLKASQSTGCNYLDYWHLYKEIRAHTPREVLECGTGVSTIVIATALEKNAQAGRPGRLTSMEELEPYYEQALALLPEKFRAIVRIVCSPRIEDFYSLYRGVRYRDVPPERHYDFVFVDGPNYIAPSDGMRTFDFDFIHVVGNSEHPVRGLVDKRVSTCYVLQKIFGPEKVRYNARLHLAFLGPCSRKDMRDFDPQSPSEAFADSWNLIGPTTLRLSL